MMMSTALITSMVRPQKCIYPHRSTFYITLKRHVAADLF